MRKILLATTALVGFVAAGAAQAATAPLNVTVGGSVDFVAGAFHEAVAAGATDPSSGDFETVYSLAFGVTGKAANGLEYGGNLVLDNEPDVADSFAGKSNTVAVTKATVFMSGAYGKLQLGDARGATDLAVTAPSVAGIRYIDFLNTSESFAKDLIVGIDGKDHSTNVTYFTPKIGGEMGKVQAAVTYAPNFNQYGSTVQLTVPTTYRNVIKGAVAYTGNVKGVALNASADIINGTIDSTTVRDFTAFGFGLAGAYQGFTLGATYTDNGDYNTVAGQKKQHILTAGLKYEFSKYAIGFDYLNGEGQSSFIGTPVNPADPATGDRVKSLDVYNFGGAYTWAPGLTTTANAVFFDQNAATNANDNSGYVLLVSQKLAF